MESNEIRISTERLILRSIRLSDAESMFLYRSEPRIMGFQSWKPEAINEVEEFIDKSSKIFNIPNTWYQLVIISKETEELIGDIGIHFLDTDGTQTEIGFTLSLEYQGRGYATESINEVINFLFSNLKKHRIFASVDPSNIKSIAVLERCGMRKEAHFKKSVWINEEWTDDIIYAILNEEWRSKEKKKEGECTSCCGNHWKGR